MRHPRQRHLRSDNIVGVPTVITDARHPQVLAGHVIAAPARLALAAMAAIKAQADALPNFPLSHAVANRIYQTNHLMPRHPGVRDWKQTFLGQRIGVANPAGLHPHPNLASLRVGHFPRYEFNWPSLADHLRIPSSQLCHRYVSFQLHECRHPDQPSSVCDVRNTGMAGLISRTPGVLSVDARSFTIRRAPRWPIT